LLKTLYKAPSSGNTSFRHAALLPDGVLVSNEGLPNQTWASIYKVSAAFAGFGPAAALNVPSEDGTLIYGFDASGRHLSTVDALTKGVLYRFGYDGAGHLATITDFDGNVTTIGHDSSGSPTNIVGPFGQMSVLSSDANGYLAAFASPANEMITATYSSGGLMQSFTTPRGLTGHMGYDSLGRLTTDTDAVNATIDLSSSGDHNFWSTSLASGEQHVTRYSTQQLLNGGRQKVVFNPDGTSVTQTFAPDGSVDLLLPSGELLQTSDIPDPRFGPAAAMSSEVTTTPGGVSRSVVRSRDVTLQNPNDPTTLQTQTDRVTINGRASVTSYNASTRTFSYSSPAGRSFTRQTDAAGRTLRIHRQNDSSNADQVSTYDPRGRLLQSTKFFRTTIFGYVPSGAGAGYLQSITDPLAQTTTFTRDAIGRALTQAAPDGASTQFSWDADGNLSSVTPPGKSAHIQTYTPVGLLSSYVPPAVPGLPATTTDFGYNLDRRPTNVTRPDAEQLQYLFDDAGRVRALTLPTGAIGYEYYPLGSCLGCAPGQLKAVRGPMGVDMTLAYDGHLLTSSAWSGLVSGSVAWTYDNDFDFVTETVAGLTGSSSVAFGYDRDKLTTCAAPTTCSPPGADSLRITRDPSVGLPSSMTLGQVSETLVFDNFQALLTKNASSSAGSLYSANYSPSGSARDVLGRVLKKTEVLNGVSHAESYTYDLQNRLVAANLDGSAFGWSYDANGNRTAATSSEGTLIGVYDAQDRLTQYGDFNFTYTANGELKTKTSSSSGAATVYEYDVLGNLLSVKLPNGTLMEYLIDGQSRRVAKKINGSLVKQWLYRDSLQLVAELDGLGNLVSEFVYGSSRSIPDYMVRGGVTYRIIGDQLGSPRIIVNATTGAVAQRMRHDAWGNVLEDTNPGFIPFGFAGGLYDSDTGLVRFGARDYDPVVGRWISKDPILFDGGQANLYVYVNNDPVNYLDRSGRGPEAAGGVLAPLLPAAAAAGAAYLAIYCALHPDVCGAAVSHAVKRIEDLCTPEPAPQPAEICTLAYEGANQCVYWCPSGNEIIRERHGLGEAYDPANDVCPRAIKP